MWLSKKDFQNGNEASFVSVDHALYILKPKDANEKCSPDVRDSNEIKNVIRDTPIRFYVSRK